jgi:Protein of unknown function (DUF3631)
VTRDDGALILEEAAATYRRYVAFAHDHQAVALALWTAHTHAIEVADTTPYMHISSAEPLSGKTRVLEVAELLVARPWMVIEPSEAVTFRMIESAQPTVLLDEVDAIWGKDADSREGLRAVLNAGYRRGATVPRCVGTDNELKNFAVFGAKALAGLRTLPGTLASRSIPIRLQRRTKSEKVEKFRQRRAAVALGRLRERLAAWTALVTDELAAADPVIPEGLTDRQEDFWEPLLAIADAAGGDWPKLAREAAAHLHGGEQAADLSVGVLLLGHIREAFTIHDQEGSAIGHHEGLPTEALLRSLVERDDGPWAGWWAKAVDDHNRRVGWPSCSRTTGSSRRSSRSTGRRPAVTSGTTSPMRGDATSPPVPTLKIRTVPLRRPLPRVPTSRTVPRYFAGQRHYSTLTPNRRICPLSREVPRYRFKSRYPVGRAFPGVNRVAGVSAARPVAPPPSSTPRPTTAAVGAPRDTWSAERHGSRPHERG